MKASSHMICTADWPLASRLADYIELAKPRMNLLVVSTTVVGFYMAGGDFHPELFGATVSGTALMAASAAVLNQLIEQRQDALMKRTADRPIPSGRVSAWQAAVFGAVLGISGLSILAAAVNSLTALLGLATVLLYLLAYTPLKRVTSLNTVVGAVPGAIPPVMGFSAVQNALSPQAMTLFAILFLWQMPHFLAIAILHREDYQAAGFRMLPCVDQDLRLTGRMILLYAAALLPASLLPAVLGMCGAAYFTAAVLLGLALLSSGVSCAVSGSTSDARQLFHASIVYLPVLLGLMIFDKI